MTTFASAGGPHLPRPTKGGSSSPPPPHPGARNPDLPPPPPATGPSRAEPSIPAVPEAGSHAVPEPPEAQRSSRPPTERPGSADREVHRQRRAQPYPFADEGSRTVRIRRKLRSRREFGDAFLLYEILGPPVGQRHPDEPPGVG